MQHESSSLSVVSICAQISKDTEEKCYVHISVPHLYFIYRLSRHSSFHLTPRAGEKLIVAQLISKFPAFYGTRYSLPCSQQPAIASYPKPDESSPHFPPYFPKICFNIVRFPARTGNFFLRHHFQTGSEAHPASHSMGTGGYFLGGEVAGA